VQLSASWRLRPSCGFTDRVSIEIPTETVCITDDDGRPVDLLSVTARKRSSNGARVSVEQT
jgi:hypothetical protein